VNSKLSYAIAVILSGSSAGLANAAPASEAESSSDMITEITVTAQRRSENAQDVPISIQAMTAETLQQFERVDVRRLHQVSAERYDGEQRAGPERGFHARPERWFTAQPGQRFDGLVAERRDLLG